MAHPRLEDVLKELGLSQYLEAFLDQGFDSWDTILDITESDLDALGVKLGHRRKLQRRIANYRGIAPDVALASPARLNVEDVQTTELALRSDVSGHSVDARGSVPGVVVKRKYRRHPKPDTCAPERPPSAYVLFSNKMREELKGHNLSFTDTAKLVGEKWQSLTSAEREPFETQAQAAKDKYSRDLSEYKITPEYSRYVAYLQEFKAKHSNQTQDKDACKRVKLSDLGSSSPSPVSMQEQYQNQDLHEHQQSHQRHEHTRDHDYENDQEHDRDPQDVCRYSYTRKCRVGSTSSASNSQFSASPMPGHVDDSAPIPNPTHHPSNRSPAQDSMRLSMSPLETAPIHGSRRNKSARRGSSGPVKLPSLSDVFDSRQLTSPPGTEAMVTSTSPGLPPAAPLGVSASSSSANSGSFSHRNGMRRIQLDGNFPIHALLSGKMASPASPQSAEVLSHHETHMSQMTRSTSTSPPSPQHKAEHKALPPWSSFSQASTAPIADNFPAYKDNRVSTILRHEGGPQLQS